MPQETIVIGGKSFEVACQDGEEQFLRAAAEMLNTEAETLISQIGRVPESRMLLMSGLMLADKTAGAEDRVKALQSELDAAKAEIEQLKSQPASGSVPAGSGVSPEQLAALTALAEQAEKLADQVEA